ncbi:hypothetical protein PT7_2688 [Pusillimonas sp. T7-7]|nr:hypothetical protein PT7_2688 [Pusillimonas sp. T7-7]
MHHPHTGEDLNANIHWKKPIIIFSKPSLSGGFTIPATV